MNSNTKDGMRYPSIDQLVEKTHSKYNLVVGVAKRARELSQGDEPEEALISNPHSKKPIGIALEEIIEGKIIIVPLNQEEDADISLDSPN